MTVFKVVFFFISEAFVGVILITPVYVGLRSNLYLKTKFARMPLFLYIPLLRRTENIVLTPRNSVRTTAKKSSVRAR